MRIRIEGAREHNLKDVDAELGDGSDYNPERFSCRNTSTTFFISSTADRIRLSS